MKKTISSLSCLDERELTHDIRGKTFNNGAFMVYESMLFMNRPITVKRLHQKLLERNKQELIINEQNILRFFLKINLNFKEKLLKIFLL